jgi:regulator of nucleoside diphosphate kinase
MAIVNMADHANLSLLSPRGLLQRKLDEADVVPTESVPADVLTMQSTVVLSDDATGERCTVVLVYPAEADPQRGRISVLDPLGAQLFAASLGDAVEDARGRRLRIAQILYQPEQSLRTNLVVRDQEK